MNLQCKAEIGLAYKAGSQIARVVSEDWCKRELYCAACSLSGWHRQGLTPQLLTSPAPNVNSASS